MRALHLALPPCLALCLAAAGAVAAAAGPGPASAGNASAPPEESTDAETPVRAAEAERSPEDAVWAADEAMAAAVARGDRDAFTELIAEDAVFISGTVLRGRRAVVAGWLPLLAPEAGTRLAWVPREAWVAKSGDLAYTVGDYQMTTRVTGGDGEITRGRYVSVWRRGEDGAWRVVADGPMRDDRAEFVRDTLTSRGELVPGTRFDIDWRPERTEVAASGELAYTLGTFDVRLERPPPPGSTSGSTSGSGPGSGSGAVVRRTGGNFLEVWARTAAADGGWWPAVDSVTWPRPVEGVSD